MMNSLNTDGYFQPMHPDVQLIKNTNHILNLIEKYEWHHQILFIESRLISAKAAFLDACIKEMKDNRYESNEKLIARNLLESTIELFEKIYKEITEN